MHTCIFKTFLSHVTVVLHNPDERGPLKNEAITYAVFCAIIVLDDSDDNDGICQYFPIQFFPEHRALFEYASIHII